jgi:RNA polymerase sigma factor (sigma-70 family)
MNNHGIPEVEEYLFLAEVIAYDYANVPGCALEEIRSEGQMALLRAKESYDSSKGDFVPYAARAIRNALNSLYAKQLKLQKMFPASLDDPVISLGTEAIVKGIEMEADGQHLEKEIRRSESARVTESLMGLLTPREHQAIAFLRLGNSFSEIGRDMGISKQAAHKSVQSGLTKLRNGLSRLGYNSLASDGFLGSTDLTLRKVDDSGRNS